LPIDRTKVLKKCDLKKMLLTIELLKEK